MGSMMFGVGDKFFCFRLFVGFLDECGGKFVGFSGMSDECFLAFIKLLLLLNFGEHFDKVESFNFSTLFLNVLLI